MKRDGEEEIQRNSISSLLIKILWILKGQFQMTPKIIFLWKKNRTEKIAVKVGLTRLNHISVFCELHEIKNGILFTCVTQSTGTQYLLKMLLWQTTHTYLGIDYIFIRAVLIEREVM